MKIGIIADTHDRMDYIERFVGLFKEKGVKVVLHAGDIVAPFAARPFKEFRFEAVFGNNCGEKLFLKKVITDFGGRIEPGPRRLDIAGKSFVLMHEPYELKAFSSSRIYDFVVYGHTHELKIEEINGIKVINPGEACGWLSGRATAVVLEPETGKIEVLEL